MPLPRGKENYMASISATPPKRREATVATKDMGRVAVSQGAVNAMKTEHVLLQSPSPKPNSMFGQKSFPIKHTFIHYDSPQKTLTISSPPKSVPPNFAPAVVLMSSRPNFTTKPGPLPSTYSGSSASLQPPGPMQTLRLSDYLPSPVAAGPASMGTMPAQGSMNCGVVNAPVPAMPDFACSQMAQGGMSGFPPVPPLPGPGQLVGPSMDGNAGNGQQTIMMGPCMEGNQCQQITMNSNVLDCSQQNCQPTVVMTQAVDSNGQAIMMGPMNPMNDGSGNFVISQMVELTPSWGECNAGNSGNAGNASMFSQCLFQTGMNGMNGQCAMIVEEPSPMSMSSMTPCNGGQMMQVTNGGNSFCMNSASSGNTMPGQVSPQSKLFRPQGQLSGRCC